MCPVSKPQWFTLRPDKLQWTLPPSHEMLQWVGCQFLVNSWNNCRFKIISANAFVRSGQKIYYSQSLLSPLWKNFQPFCEKLAADSKYWLRTSASIKQRFTHIKTKPKQSKTMIHWWSHEIWLHKGHSCLTCILFRNTNITSAVPMLFTRPAFYTVLYVMANH